MSRRAKQRLRRSSGAWVLLGAVLLASCLGWVLGDFWAAPRDEKAQVLSGADSGQSLGDAATLEALAPRRGEVARTTEPFALTSKLDAEPESLRGELRLEITEAATGALVPGLRARLGRQNPILKRFEVASVLRADELGRLQFNWPTELDGFTLIFDETASTRRLQWRPARAGDHRIELPPRGGQFHGVVLDEDLQAVADAEVRAWRGQGYDGIDWDAPALHTLSDEQGRWQMHNVLSERGGVATWSLAAVTSTGRTSHRSSVDVLGETPREKPVLLVLAPRSDVTGFVVDDDGQPIERALVTARHLGSRFEEWRNSQTQADQERLPRSRSFSKVSLLTNADGHFALPLCAEEWSLEINRANYFPWSGSASSNQELRVVLRSGATLRGIVRDDRGAPLKGARVRVWDRKQPRIVPTKADGSFVLTRLSEEREWPVHIAATGFATHRSWVQLSRDTDSFIDVQLARGKQLRVRLEDESGGPLAGWQLSLRDEHPLRAAPGDPWLDRVGTQLGSATDEHGLASFDDLGVTAVRVIVQEPIQLAPLAAAVLTPDDTLHTIIVSDHDANFARVHMQLLTSTPDAPLQGWRLNARLVLENGVLGSRYSLGLTNEAGRSTRSLVPGRWQIEGTEPLLTQRDGFPARRITPVVIQLLPGPHDITLYEAAP